MSTITTEENWTIISQKSALFVCKPEDSSCEVFAPSNESNTYAQAFSQLLLKGASFENIKQYCEGQGCHLQQWSRIVTTQVDESEQDHTLLTVIAIIAVVGFMFIGGCAVKNKVFAKSGSENRSYDEL